MLQQQQCRLLCFLQVADEYQPSTSAVSALQHRESFDEQRNIESSGLKTCKYDIGSYIDSRDVGDDEKEAALKNTWTPNVDFKFECQIRGKKKRNFQLGWLERFRWLAYSNEKKRSILQILCFLWTQLKQWYWKGISSSCWFLGKNPFYQLEGCH